MRGETDTNHGTASGSRYLLGLLMFAAVSLVPAFSPAAAVSPPPELNQWKAWLLDAHPDIACPRLGTVAQQQHCAWPGTLSIQVTETGATFSQEWAVYGRSWVSLPGDSRHWPEAVQLNDQPAAVLERNGRPALHLEPGRYRVTGGFSWRERPQSLQIPRETGLVDVRVDDRALAFPNIDNGGRLWFQRPGSGDQAQKENSVDARVFRRLDDGVPVTMDTVLRLVVSGSPRELQLGRFLLADSEPTRFNSPLPARIEDDGKLRIQVRAGTWEIRLSSRFRENVAQLRTDKATRDWPAQEIWSFNAAPNIRGVKITGVQPVDPGQIDMPPGWKNLPTYLVEPDDTFTLEEQYRGDAAPSANQIHGTRILWLDFDGQGATVKDNLSGRIHQGWRLSVQPAMQLGRVTVNGQPRLVTRLEKDGPDGVEIRQSNFQVEAVSRLQDTSDLTATGWRHDMDSLSMTLNLPPGWQLWHAGGADSVNASWLSRWDLWDVFLCLLIVGAVFRLLGLPWAALAALTLALTYHESNAPVFSWVVLIVIVPLLKVLPQNWFRRTVANLGYLTLLVLIMVILVFAVQQVRRGLYPQLEQQRVINQGSVSYVSSASRPQPAAPPPQRVEEKAADLAKKAENVGGLSREMLSGLAEGEEPREQKRYQPEANTQTGPGEPTWGWNRVRLTWSGPVKADAPVKLYLTGSGAGRVLMFLQVLLVGALAFGFIRLFLRVARKPPEDPEPENSGTAAAAVAGLLLLGALGGVLPQNVQARDFPPEYLMKDWTQRLLQPPDCVPDCAALNQVAVAVGGDHLTLRLRASAGTDLGLALPRDDTWRITRIAVDGEPSDRVLKNGNRLLLYLQEGEHDIQIDGRIQGDTINIPFTRNPHNVSVSAQGWEVFGLVEKRVPGGSLQLQKHEKAAARDTLLPDPIPPFVRVERRFRMDQDWTVTTTMSRVAPAQGGITVNIPLLDGESVVSENTKVVEQDGQRFVPTTLGGNQATVSWASVIEPAQELTLTAPGNPAFTESWTVDASPRWHFNYQGLTPVKPAGGQNGAVPQWLPWPGETLTISAVKPQPVPGPTTTVESVQLNSEPGARSTDVTLTLKIRTSLGGDFRLQQPDNADLERVEIEGREVPKQREGDTVILPLHPGLQTATVSWSISEGVRFKTSTPQIKLSTPASNIDLQMSLPTSRWPLLLQGPDIGPAMLYWGVLIVILFIAVALGRVNKQFNLNMPVTTWQWVLLALGMSTVNMVGSIPVVLWFFAMQARARLDLPEKRGNFNLMQLGLVLLSIIAVISLFSTIPESLLSTPDMQVSGNGSYNYLYKWYQDNSPQLLPQGHAYSAPIWVYRIAMLAWSLWLVFALLRWARWGWQCFSKEKLWAAKPRKSESDQKA